LIDIAVTQAHSNKDRKDKETKLKKEFDKLWFYQKFLKFNTLGSDIHRE